MACKFLLLTFTVFLSFFADAQSREDLEIGGGGIGIGIGIGGGSSCGGCNPMPPPPPPPAKCPPPPRPPPPPSPPPPSPPPPSPPPPSPPPPSPPPPSPPPPSPPPPPPPPQFYNERIKRAYKVIQRFKRKITSDPQGITDTWNGVDVCNVNRKVKGKGKGKRKYKGFYCAEAPGTHPKSREALAVAAVDFNGYKLGAESVEEFIEGLTDIAFVHANSNKFKGGLNINFTKLPFFYELDLSNNHIAGSFPTSVLTLNLTFLDLRFNNFYGPVPREVFLNYKYAEVIFLNNNGFSQSIPDDFGKTPAQYLTFANNQFTGGIPRSIKFLADNLLEVLFLNNKLSGCIPYEVGLLAKATVFDAGYNQLTGPIPLSLGCLDKIEQLNFAGNRLYGHIPELVCKLGRLQNLSLSDNYFTSVGPACQQLIKRGILDVRKNCIFGLPNQRHPYQCAAFFWKPLQCKDPANNLKIPCGKHPWPSSFEGEAAASPPYPLTSWTESLTALPPSSTAEMERSAASPSPSPSYAALTAQRG